MTWYVTAPLPNGSCGTPCNFGFNEWMKDPFHCIFFQPQNNTKLCAPVNVTATWSVVIFLYNLYAF